MNYHFPRQCSNFWSRLVLTFMQFSSAALHVASRLCVLEGIDNRSFVRHASLYILLLSFGEIST